MLRPRDLIEDFPVQAFTCNVARFPAYQAEIIDDLLYIVGVSNAEDDEKHFFIESCDETSLFISLLQLYERLSSLRYGYSSAPVQSVDIAHIINWCSVHGMPMEAPAIEMDSFCLKHGEDGMPMKAPTIKRNTIWLKYGKVGFLVSAFYNQLHDLHTCYQLWRRIEFKDTEKHNFYAKTPIDKCKSMLQGHMLTLSIQLYPDFSRYPPTFYLRCDNLMAVAKAQLFFLCMSKGVSYLGVCAVCGEPFAKSRKNNTLCPECQRVKYRRSRDKARAASRKAKGKEEQ